MRRREGASLSVEVTLAVPRDDLAVTQNRGPPRRVQSKAARSCANLRQRVGAGPDAARATHGRPAGQGGRGDITLVENKFPPCPLQS